MNDLLAEALGLTDTEVLVPTYSDPLKKLAVYVPKDYEEAVRTALGNAGAGHIGNYSHCAFSSEGIGSFKPLDGAEPFIGQTGELELVHEVRLETVFPASMEKTVVKALKKAIRMKRWHMIFIRWSSLRLKKGSAASENFSKT